MIGNKVVTLGDPFFWVGGGRREVRDGPLFFIKGVTIFGTCRQFFLKSNAFQTIILITFCNENTFFTTIFKNVTGFFIVLI